MNKSKKSTQLRVIFNLLQDKSLTRNQIELETGIRINSVTWRIHDLMKVDRAAVIRKVKCPITGEIVGLLTSNKDLFPNSNQQNLFD